MSAAAQGELWSVDPAGWATRAEARNRPLFEALLARLDPRPGERLLDVGCGSGLLCELAARRGALVTAVNVLPYADDRRRAAAELARVAAPGGRVAATVGAGREEQACAALVDPLAPPAEVPDWEHEVDVRRPGALAGMLAAAGLEVLDEDEIAFDAEYADVDDAVAGQLPAGPVEAAIRHSGREAVEGALRAFFTPRARPDGSVALPVAYRVALARRPQDRLRERAMA